MKCCLNFELDSYLDAIKSFPSTELRLKTEHGHGVHIKTDVFKRTLWYAFNSTKTSAPSGLVPLSPERVKEIIAMNKSGKFPADLKEFKVEVAIKEPDYSNVDGQENLDRFDHKFKKKKKKKGGNPNQKSNQKIAKGKNNPNQKQGKPQGKNPNNKQGQPKKANPNAQNNDKANRNNPNFKPKGEKKGKPNQKKLADGAGENNKGKSSSGKAKNPNQKPKQAGKKPRPKPKAPSVDKPKSTDEAK